MAKKNIETVSTGAEEKQAQEQEVQETEPKFLRPLTNPISVVIPYLRSKAQGEELRHAVISIQKHFKEDFQIIVVGDREDWFEEEEILYIEHICSDANPQIDVRKKMELVLASGILSENFVWTNDDIYFVSPVMMADIQILKCNGVLEPDKFKDVYARNMRDTVTLLDSYKLPKRNYATHIPVVFNTVRLQSMLEHLPDKDETGYLISSLYFNSQYPGFIPVQMDWKTDNWCLPIKSQNPDAGMFRELLAKKKFLNNAESGYSEFLMSELDQLLEREAEDD